MAPISSAAILRDARECALLRMRTFFLVAFFFFAADFTLAADLRAAAFLASGFALRDFGRLFSAARCAAAKAALAHTLSSSESSNSRAGNCQ